MLIINRLPEGAYTGNRRVMKREKVRAEELDFKYTDDKDTCQFLPLIEKPVGDVTYEQCLAVRFYGDVYMGTAQRNYYVDRYQEICLCAHYNRRILGKYEFEERIKIVVEPQSGRHGNKAILEIALFFHENSLQMRQKLIEGYSFEPREGEIDTIINFFEQHDILYRIISPPDPRDKYLYYKECNYLHSQMKKYKNGSSSSFTSGKTLGRCS